MLKKREKYLDVLKGMSIIAIVFLHFEEGVLPKHLNVWIGSFMIVAFYFSSGWLQGILNRETTIAQHIKKRKKNLIIPYFWFSLIIIVFDLILVLLNFSQPKILLVDIYKTLILRGIGTLWFLPALLGGEIIFIFFKNKSVQLKLLLLFFTIIYLAIYKYWSDSIGHASEFYRIIDAPFRTLNNIMNAWILIAAGYYISKRFNKKIESMLTSKLLLITSIMLLIGYLSVYLSFVLNSILYTSVVQPLFVSVICPFSILLFSILTQNINYNKFFVFWGKNSLALMVIHYSIVMQICILIDIYIFKSNEFIGYKTIIYFILTMIIHYPIILFINKKAKFLIGK